MLVLEAQIMAAPVATGFPLPSPAISPLKHPCSKQWHPCSMFSDQHYGHSHAAMCTSHDASQSACQQSMHLFCMLPTRTCHRQVSIERTLGTIIGGVLGYFAVIFNRSITLTDMVIFGPLSAAAVAAVGVLVGRALRLEYSAKLFCMTYILVLMGADEASGTCSRSRLLI